MMAPEEDDFHIYSPEKSDGHTDWPSRIAQLLLLAVLIGLAIVGFRWALSPTEANAQQGQCGPMDEADAKFLKSYNEAISGAGMGEMPTEAWSVMVSPDGETFTIIKLLLSLKMVCIVGSGTGWAQIPVPHFQEPKQKL